MGSKPLVPRLRFPEFMDGPGWREVILREVLHEHGAKSDGLSEVHSVSVHKGVINQIEHLGRSFAASNTDHYSLVKPHDVIYTKSPTGDFPFGIVKQSRLPYPVIVSPLYGVFSPANEHIGYILDAYFESPTRTNNYLDPITQKGAKNTIQISNDTFLSRGLHLPEDRHEQQKIADCLTSLDEVIAAEGRMLEAVRTFKKGLLQNLFPRPERTENGVKIPAETTPRLRFPEFHNAGKWEEEKVGKFVDIWSGGSPSQFVLLAEGTYPFVKVEDLNNCDKYQVTGRSFCDDADGVVPSQSILFPKRGAAIENNKIRVTVTEMLIDTNLMAITPKDGLTTEFLFYYLSNVGLSHIADTSTIPQINNKHIIPFDLLLPSPAEQQRIAACLGSLDALITSQAEKLDTLKHHKLGLMQSLFPSPEGD